MPEIPTYQSRGTVPTPGGGQLANPAIVGGEAIAAGADRLTGGLYQLGQVQQQQVIADQIERAGEILTKSERDFLDKRDLIASGAIADPDHVNPEAANALRRKPMEQDHLLRRQLHNIAALAREEAKAISPQAAKYVELHLRERLHGYMDAFSKDAMARQGTQNRVSLYNQNQADIVLGRQAPLKDDAHLKAIAARLMGYAELGQIDFSGKDGFQDQLEAARKDILLGQASTFVNQNPEAWLEMQAGKEPIGVKAEDLKRNYQIILATPGVDLDSLSEKARSSIHHGIEVGRDKERTAANQVKDTQDRAANLITMEIQQSTAADPFTNTKLLAHAAYPALNDTDKRTLETYIRTLDAADAPHDNLVIYESLREKLFSPYLTVMEEVTPKTLQRHAENKQLKYETAKELIRTKEENAKLLLNEKLSTFFKEARDAEQTLRVFFDPLQGVQETREERVAKNIAVLEFHEAIWKEARTADTARFRPDQLERYKRPMVIASELINLYGAPNMTMRGEQLQSLLDKMGLPTTAAEAELRLTYERALRQIRILELETKKPQPSSSGTRVP